QWAGYFNGKVNITSGLYANGTAGTSGQVLTSSGGGAMTWTSITPSANVDGTGTANYLARWTDANSLGIGVAYDNGTNVGIGTTSPASKLNVVGNVYVDGDWTNDAEFRIREGGSPDYGAFFKYGSGDLLTLGTRSSAVEYINMQISRGSLNTIFNGGVGIGASPVNKLDVEGGAVIGSTYSGSNTAPTNGLLVEGNVGIGTTNPDAAVKLHVSGGGIGLDNNQGIWAKTAAGTMSTILWLNASNMTHIRGVGGGFSIDDGGGAPLVTVLNGGNVGIGSTNPVSKLTVAGTGAVPLLQLSNVTMSSVSGGDLVLRNLGQLRFSDVNTWDWNAWAGIKFVQSENKIVIGGPASSYFTANASPPTVCVVFDGVNNVGIGTTNPTYKLHVVGTMNLTSALYANGTAGTSGQVLTSTGGGAMTWTSITPTANVDGSGTANYLARWTDPNSLGIGVTYDNGTNVGIGTTGPQQKLNIIGTTRITDPSYSNPSGDYRYIDIYSSAAQIIKATNDLYIWSGNGLILQPGYPTSGSGNIQVKDGGGNVYTTFVGSTQRVGIGTSTPTNKLQVNGTFGVDVDNNSTSPPHTGYVASADIAFSRDDISGWTAGPSGDDVLSGAITIPTFNMFGTDYTTIYISTNGWVSFGSAASNTVRNPGALPSSSFTMPAICVYANDMQTRGNGIRYTTVGISPNRTFIVDFEIEDYYSPNGDITAQLQLHEGSNLINIRYYYTSPDLCGQSGTIGIQGAGGSIATAVPITYNGKVLDDNANPQSISFCPVKY
ncbi:MAG TPA: hypothetical protein PKN48_14535, partial [Bacteroidales bacterium]|nr:hypothetical protein [Bacteroidales bacterium]